MKDYYTWFAKMRSKSIRRGSHTSHFCHVPILVKVGNTIGWGVFYSDDCQDDKAEQLCLVYVMFNKLIVDVLFVLQPEGGFVPIVLLQPYGNCENGEGGGTVSTDVFAGFFYLSSNQGVHRAKKHSSYGRSCQAARTVQADARTRH